MKNNDQVTKKWIKVSEKELLSLVAFKLKDRILFPEKVEKLKYDLRKIEIAK
jgi:hypothetical protein